MKKITLVFAISLGLMACNEEKKETTEKAPAAETKAAVKLPYELSYSSSFEMGDPAHSAMILQGSWKDWETNNLDNMKSWLADTIVAFHSDNSMVNGADSLMARWKRGRAGLTNVIDTVHSVIPLYSTDKKENWVLVWASEISTNDKGIKDTTELMETWRINKDGKADMLLQFDRKKRKP